MKIGNPMKILTPLVAAMFILSLFSGAVAAQTPTEVYDKEKEQYKIVREKYDNTKERFEKAKVEFERSRERLKSATDRPSRAELENKTKDYVIRAIDQTIAHLEVLKNKVENSENKDILPAGAAANIEAQIARMKELKTKVEKATTVTEIREAYQELKDTWIKIRLETRYYLGIVLNNRIDKFIIKTEEVKNRMDESIEKLKAKGIDTSKLEEDRTKFNDLVTQAKNSQKNTAGLFATHSGFETSGKVTDNKAAQKFIQEVTDSQKETIKKLREASRQVIQFVKDYRKLNNGAAFIEGTGTMVAKGNGRAVIEGNVTVELKGGGNLIVSSNAKVVTDGKGTNETLGNGDVKYQGFGSATIKGENIRVEISGNNIDLKATGTGSATLSGTGTYRTEKGIRVSGEWNKED